MFLKSLACELRKFSNGISQFQSIDDYMADIKKIFLEKLKNDRAMKNIDPDKLWKSIEHSIRRDVERQIGDKGEIL